MTTLVKRRPMVMLRMKEVAKRTGLSKSTIYNKLDPASPHHDPQFPTRVRLTKSTVAFLESEIEAWLEQKIGQRIEP